ncbi:MAG: hypothetical protein KDE27_16280 [Planctomycetes bacterium]|nr:hypothetical protein [Planctomycetota bacterium]
MTLADVIEDARAVWLYGVEPKCSVEDYDRATETLFEELMGGGRKPDLSDPRLRLLMNAKSKFGEVHR